VRELWRSCQSLSSEELRDPGALMSEAGGDTTDLAEERRERLRTGRLDTPPHSQLLLATVARLARAAAGNCVNWG
jgi:hypothetical protein